MKIVSVALVLAILVLASVSTAAVMEIADSDNDGVIESPVDGAAAVKGNQGSNNDLAEPRVWYEFQVQAEGNEANADPGNTGNANILVVSCQPSSVG